MNDKSFVMYESVHKHLERLSKKLGKEAAFDFLMAVNNYGLYGELPDEDDDAWLYGLEQTITSISKAKDRYTAAVENGKKGGRKQTIDRDKVLELKAKGNTNKAIAEELGCSVSSIEKIVSTNQKNQKNLNDNDNVNDNNNVNDTKYQKSSNNDIMKFKYLLEHSGKKVTVRLERGADIDAACGQLAGKS